MKKRRTNRGFQYLEFKDIYGLNCFIQKSSLATKHAIWIGIESKDVKITEAIKDSNGSYVEDIVKNLNELKTVNNSTVYATNMMHIDIKTAKQIIKVLQHFVDTGDLYERFNK